MAFLRAFSTLGCVEAGLDEALALAQRHGLDGIELRGLGGQLDLPAHFAATAGSPAALAVRQASRPPAPRVLALDTSCRLADATAADRAALAAHAPWADALGAPWLRVFDGGAPGATADRARMLATLAWWRAERAARGWRADLMVETHDALLRATEIAALLAAAPGTAILWDAHHTWKKGGEDPLATWAAIRPHVVHVHVKDSVSRPGARHPFTYVLPGEGEFPAARLLPVLRREFTGAVCLEWERHWHPALPALALALTTARDRAWW